MSRNSVDAMFITVNHTTNAVHIILHLTVI